MSHNLTELLLVGILAAQILILLRLPKSDNSHRRRKRRKLINKIAAKVKRQ